MKQSLLTGFRAMAFALGAFLLLLTVGGIKVRSALDVAGFVLGLAAFWVVIEKVMLGLKRGRSKPPPK